MPVRNEHLVVIMLEPTPLGKEFEVWPPKITIVPWFPVDDESKLDELLNSIAKKHKKFSTKAGKKETWGNKTPFDVAKIDDSGELHRLHQDIFQGLEKNGFPIHQKDFLGDKYTPHVTLRNRLQLGWNYRPGQKIDIDRFALVKQLRLKGSGRMIKTLKKEYSLV